MIFFQLNLQRFIACMREEMQFERVCLKRGNVEMPCYVRDCYAFPLGPYFMHAHM